MIKVTVLILMLTGVVTAFSPAVYASSGLPRLQTASMVDLGRYMGGWHEISRLEHWFQKNCSGSFAEYRLRPDGEVDVLNSCIDERSGIMREARGRAWSVDTVDNSKLKVSFFWPFRGDYWIIELGETYNYSVVGSPDRKYLWILAREPVIDAKIYQGILDRLRSYGFAVDSLVSRPTKKVSSN